MVMENDNLTSMRIIIDPATAFTLLLFSRTASTVAHTVAKLYFLSKNFLSGRKSAKSVFEFMQFYEQVQKSLVFTLFEIFIFCPKIQLSFPEIIVDFFGWKTHENVLVLDFLAVDNIDFTRKIVKKNVWKTRENVWFLSKLNFWTKIWLLE